MLQHCTATQDQDTTHKRLQYFAAAQNHDTSRKVCNTLRNTLQQHSTKTLHTKFATLYSNMGPGHFTLSWQHSTATCDQDILRSFQYSTATCDQDSSRKVCNTLRQHMTRTLHAKYCNSLQQQTQFHERVNWCFEPSQALGVISGLKETFLKTYIVERTNKAEIRLEEHSKKTESCQEN